MRKSFLLLFFLCTGMMLHAQTAEKKWALGLGGGAYYGTELEGTGLITEIYLSRYLNRSFDLMLLNNVGLFNSEVNQDLDMGSTFLNLRYKLSNGYIFKENSAVQPYLFAGPGFIQDNQTSGLNFDAGLGFKFPLSSSVALFVEGGYIEGIGDDKASDENTFSESFLKGLVGVEISFGKTKDSDKDGVPDRKDKCPNTPEGVAVDADGCPLDTDGDSVPDYKDDCPTEPGDVALNGCPDRDRDGVPDKDDECPDVPGLKQFKGCPDTDGDGVVDSKDDCPNTPKGYKVDAKGCPIDTDGDGLVDEEDDCPTEAGPKENKGCPVVGMKFNLLLFDFDQSKLKPEAIKELDNLVKAMNENKGFSVNLYGHADEIGTEEYNMGLSEKRAKAARKYLTDKGIAPERIATVKWFGKSKPIAPNNEAGRAQNRRVEIEIAK